MTVKGVALECQAIGWDVCVVPTRVGRRFLGTGALAKLTGHPLRDDYKVAADLYEAVKS